MSGYVPDPLLVEVFSQGANQPCRIRLTLPDGSGSVGELDIAALENRLANLPWDWEDAGKTYGQAIFEALFPGTLSNQFSAALQASRGRGLRFALQIDPALPALHRLPWERLYFPQGSQWIPLAVSPAVVFSRFLQTGQPWGVALPVGPLKLLLVISSPFPAGSNLYVDVANEQQAIQAVLDHFPGQIEMEVLAGAISAQQLSDHLAQGSGYDLLHYVGHGEWRADEQRGYLIFSKQYEDGTWGPAGVLADELTRLFTSTVRLPQLITLGACESGQQSTLDAFKGVGPQLVQAGCPAVICNQEKVENAVARQFSVDFYTNLLESGCVDLAVNRARTGLLEHQYLQWAVPVLYMRLADGILFVPQQRFKPVQRQPYKFLAPYQRLDTDLFKGREAKIAECCRSINENRITVVFGETGVGVTSLFQAGITPRLESDRCLVVRIADYPNVASEFRKALQIDGKPTPLKIAGDAPLATVLRAVNPARFSTIILALDQFENACALPAMEQQAILEMLKGSVQALGERLKLVFLIHKDALPGLTLYQSLINPNAGTWIEVFPLAVEEALAAIIDPLDVLGWPVTLNPIFAREQIVPDLSAIYPDRDSTDGKSWIDPGQLQIACTWLYQKARERRPPLIDETLYVKEAGGADGILVRYMEEELNTHFAGQSDLARAILAAMAAPDMERWILPEQLMGSLGETNHREDLLDRITSLLNQFARAEILVRQLRENGYVYAFANQMIADEAFRLGGEKTELAYQAGDEVERAWRLWLSSQTRQGAVVNIDDALATRQQLRMLVEFGHSLDPKPVKLLLLLRSAVYKDEPPMPWLARLKEKEITTGMIQTMEGAGSNLPPLSGSMREMAGRLLGLSDPAMPIKPDPQVGDIAWIAASSQNSVSRRTAALALTTIPASPQEITARIDRAIDGLQSGLRKMVRRSELMGTLADAGFAQERPGELPGRGKAGIYLWRTWRRVFLNRRAILWTGLGGGIGAGIGLGLERLLIGSLAQSHIGMIFFALFSYWGLLLVGGTRLVMGFAGPMLLQNSPYVGKDHRRTIVEVVLGSLGFGLMNLIVAVLNGISLARAPLVIPLGFVAGLGVAVALSGTDLKKWGRFLRILLGITLFVLAHAVFLISPESGSGISISLSAAYFQVEFEYFSWTAWQSWIQSVSGWPVVLALVEAGLAGIALILGGKIGSRFGQRWSMRWQEFIERTRE